MFHKKYSMWTELSMVRGGFFVFMTFLVISHGYAVKDEISSELDSPVPVAFAQGVVGKKASLPCDTQSSLPNDLVSMVLWFKDADGEPLYSYDVRGRQASQPKLWSSPTGFGARAYFRTSVNPAVLLVDNVVASDAGVYRCRVDFTNTPTRNMRVNFTVIEPPDRPVILDAKTRDQKRLLEPYNEGDNVELSCETRGGDPPPHLTWYLENTIIDDSFDHRPDGVTVNNLTFPNIGRQHLNARLVCQASNTNLTAPLTKLLIMDINLRPLTVQILNKNRQLSADRSYDVECQATGSRPDARITWWKGNRQIKKDQKVTSTSNITSSVLVFVPAAEDHGDQLVCRADNPRVPPELEDRWLLNVHYVPLVTLNNGRNLDPNNVKVGDDVYFECSVEANPKEHRIAWYKGDKMLQHNSTAGVLLSQQTLVLQNVRRTTAGDYSCLAQNSEGAASSSPVSLHVLYAPLCKTSKTIVHGAMKEETITLTCEVDSRPAPANFSWSLKSSSGYVQLNSRISIMDTITPESLATDQNNTLYSVPKLNDNLVPGDSTAITSGLQSTLAYTPKTNADYGTVVCTALNVMGQQEIPCLFRVISAGKPSAVHNCSMGHHTAGLLVECLPGSDGGMPQVFTMEVLELPSLLVRANITSDHPTFEVFDIDRGSRYALNIYGVNAKGKGELNTLYTAAVKSPDKYVGASTQLPLSPMLTSMVVVVGLLFAAACAVIAAMYRRHVANEQRDKHPPSVNALYMERSEESLSKLDTNTYCGSPKLDYSQDTNTYCGSPKLDYRHYDLKDEVDDPDVIPCQFTDKRPIDSTSTVPPVSANVHRIYNEQILIPPSMSSSTSVNRGVTARSSEIQASYHPEIPAHVRESCI